MNKAKRKLFSDSIDRQQGDDMMLMTTTFNRLTCSTPPDWLPVVAFLFLSGGIQVSRVILAAKVFPVSLREGGRYANTLTAKA